jgi:hypothetical protein
MLKGLQIRGIIGVPASKIGSVDVLAAVYRDVVEALKHAHSKSIIHLDVRPKNIIYVKDEGGTRAQLIDWGCAWDCAIDSYELPGFRGSLPFAHDALLIQSETSSPIRAVEHLDWASLAYTMAAILFRNDGHAPWWGFYCRRLPQEYLNRRNSQAWSLIDKSDLSTDIKNELKEAIPLYCYPSIHERYMRQALESIEKKAITNPTNIAFSTLSRSGFVCHLPKVRIPATLQTETRLVEKAEVQLGDENGIGVVRAELGRGKHRGVVALLALDENSAGASAVAVKVQPATGLLAFEYEILQKIETRVGGSDAAASFPRPLAFLSLENGALMSMTARSMSSMNLVDLSKFYGSRRRGALPELIALYYTARMLRHIKVLHKRGKILVSCGSICCGSDCSSHVKRTVCGSTAMPHQTIGSWFR